MKVVIFFALVAVCAAQLPSPCTTRPQWEGRRLRTLSGSEDGILEMYSYDETNKRTRAVEEVRQGKERNFYDVLHLHNVMKEYRIDLRTRKCNVSDLSGEFRYKGVPPGSTLAAAGTYGAVQLPNESISVQNWFIKFPDNSSYYTIVTSPDCVPVIGIYSGKEGVEHENFFDIHLGITDPSVFIPPPECA